MLVHRNSKVMSVVLEANVNRKWEDVVLGVTHALRLTFDPESHSRFVYEVELKCQAHCSHGRDQQFRGSFVEMQYNLPFSFVKIFAIFETPTSFPEQFAGTSDAKGRPPRNGRCRAAISDLRASAAGMT